MKLLNNNRGMALVVALAVVLVMSTAALQLHSNERNNMLNAAAMRDRHTLDQMTTSAIHLAMAVLIKDGLDTQIDSVQESWADPETMKALLLQIPFEKGTVEVKITDELSKIQINALIQYPSAPNQVEDLQEQESPQEQSSPPEQNQSENSQKPSSPSLPNQFNESQKQLWIRMFNKLLMAIELLDDEIEGVEEMDKDTIVSSLKDWLDDDEDLITGGLGAESDYYETLDPPYACKNGPFDHLSEVQLVKGITPELFNGIGELGGLSDHITVYGVEKAGDQKFTYPGKININTAPLMVLSMLFKEGTEDFANMLVAFREATTGTSYTNELTGDKWYSKVLAPVGIELDEELITTKSNIFQIVATAELNGSRGSTTAIVSREKKSETSALQCKVLNWKSE